MIANLNERTDIVCVLIVVGGTDSDGHHFGVFNKEKKEIQEISMIRIVMKQSFRVFILRLNSNTTINKLNCFIAKDVLRTL